jgi:hypothetical protein
MFAQFELQRPFFGGGDVGLGTRTIAPCGTRPYTVFALARFYFPTRDRVVNKHGGARRRRLDAVAGHWTGTAKVSTCNGLFTAMQRDAMGEGGAGRARAVAGGRERGEKRATAASEQQQQQRQRDNVPGAERIGCAGSGVGSFQKSQYRSRRGAANEDAKVQRAVVQV